MTTQQDRYLRDDAPPITREQAERLRKDYRHHRKLGNTYHDEDGRCPESEYRHGRADGMKDALELLGINPDILENCCRGAEVAPDAREEPPKTRPDPDSERRAARAAMRSQARLDAAKRRTTKKSETS